MKNAKVLIVDDSYTKRALYKNELEKANYDVVEAIDGLEGLAEAKAELPDVIVADMAMPKMNGLKMIQVLKSEEKTRYIPVICVSATYKDIETKMQALTEAGAEEFFYMPESMSELLLKVTVMMRIRKVYLELLEKNRQLKLFNDAAVGRELKMVELKEKIGKLEAELAKCKNGR